MANVGGAWDNAKKYIKGGYFGGKGSDAHKASVNGHLLYELHPKSFLSNFWGAVHSSECAQCNAEILIATFVGHNIEYHFIGFKHPFCTNASHIGNGTFYAVFYNPIVGGNTLAVNGEHSRCYCCTHA